MAHLPPTHWAVASGVAATFRHLPYAVAIATVPPAAVSSPPQQPPTRVALYLNPTETTCYRMLARVLYDAPDDIPFNAMHAAGDVVAVATATAAFAAALRQATGLFVQTLHLGNNSMACDPATGDVVLGTDHEPYFYHVHLLCRGNPDRVYFPSPCAAAGADTDQGDDGDATADAHGDGAPRLGGPAVGVNFSVQHANKQPPTATELAALRRGMQRVVAGMPVVDGGVVFELCE